ncbi:exonuclease domain-containing protein [Terrabacter carboxydivorans]|uniref:Exonuclease domain-containing protein n=1 Tax=Terrabacter carboxydivorans TaxID=619730 RepID=A0ABN3MG60_9MICO
MGIFHKFRRNKVIASVAQRFHPTPDLSSSGSSVTAPPLLAKVGTQPRFAVIDVETTGVSPKQHRILEIAVVTTDLQGRVLDEWSTRINPQGPVGATHIHGITDADVAHAPAFPNLIDGLNLRLKGAAIAAHNAKFDLAFLRAEYARAGWNMPFLPALCTLEASNYHLPGLDRRRLADCCWAIGTPLTSAHSALGDAQATAALVAAFMHPRLGRPPLPEHLELPQAAMNVMWPTEPSWAPHAHTTTARTFSARAQVVMARSAVTAPPPALVKMVEQFSLVDALDEGAPAGALPYLEKLAEVLEDGEVTAEEAADLAAVAEAHQLTKADVASANLAFVRALAYAALDDGKVSRAERSELQQISDLLAVNRKVLPALLDHAEDARNERLSAGLKGLPIDWAHGEPLRVGQKVVFTGCDETVRAHLEERSEKLGVRIINSVSAKTAMLVTDGAFDGVKAARARELGTRIVGPDLYAVLLGNLQPALVVRTETQPATVTPSTPRSPQEVTGAPAYIRGATNATSTGPFPADVRAWARANGHAVGTRGRLHADLIRAYEDATGQRVAADDRGRNPYNSRLQEDRLQRCAQAVALQRQGLSRAQICDQMGVGPDTVKILLRDGKFYGDPNSDPARAELAVRAADAGRHGQTRSEFQQELGLSVPKSEEAWRDSAVLHG